MLVVLAGLQFHWTGQLSRAEESMMQNALENSMRQFEQAVQRELTFLMLLFQQRVRGRPRQDPASYAQSYAIWSQTTSHPQILSRILLYSAEPDGSQMLRELPLGEGEVWMAARDTDVSSLQERLDRFRAGPGTTPDQRLPSWTFFPEERAIVRPEFEPDSAPRTGSAGYLILVLDWDYIRDHVLPGLVDRMFSGPDGDRLYEVAVVASTGPHFLYRSEPSIRQAWLAAADSRRRFRLLMPTLPRGRGGLRERIIDNPDRQLRPGSDTNDRSFGARGPGATRRPTEGMGRPRIFVAGIQSPLALEVAATHVSGSLSTAVQLQRARSLTVGLGVLAILAFAVAAVVVTARRAQQLAEMQVQFIAGVTHELRTPLAVIRSAGENIADGVVTPDRRVRKYGELVRDQGLRLSEMVEQTLQFAAIDADKRPFRLEPLDVSKVVEDVLERAGPIISQAGFTVERDADSAVPAVRADEQAVQQILGNLVGNAIKYGKPGRWMRVETCLDESGHKPRVRVSVLDRGMGIPEDEAGRIFEPYFRGAGASEASIQGSGLGLKLARDLAVRMGGNLDFRSEVGKGSVFTLYLPVDQIA